MFLDSLSVPPVVDGAFGLTPKPSNSPGPPQMASFEGSNGDICSGHAVDVDDPERKLDDGLSGLPCKMKHDNTNNILLIIFYCLTFSTYDRQNSYSVKQKKLGMRSLIYSTMVNPPMTSCKCSLPKSQ